ncbi:MAG: caspase family protein [Caldilineaceae bacterium]
MNVRHLCPFAAEQTPSSNEQLIRRREALVIGIDAYGPNFNRLANAVHDASAIAALLVQEYNFTLVPSGTALLNQDATLAAIRTAITTSMQGADATTQWLLFFAGHGVVHNGEGYLLPTDAVVDRPDTYLPLAWLLNHVLASACGEVLLILDACYSGQALVRPDQLSDLIPANESAVRVRQLLTSGNPDQPVLDGGGNNHSVFTQSLLEALQGWTGIHTPDGAIPFSRLLDQLTGEIPARLRSRQRGPVRQQPIGGNLIGNRLRRDFVFHCTLPRLSPETMRGARSDDATHRRQNIAHLVDEVGQFPDRRALAVAVAQFHLQPAPLPDSPIVVAPVLHYEPDVRVRTEAAHTLGLLGDPNAASALITALDDEPAVCRAAADALGQLRVTAATAPLRKHLQRADDSVFLAFVDAISAIGEEAAILGALQEARSRNRLVPFVGPDLPQELTGLPARATVAQRLAQQRGQPPTASLASAAALSMAGGVSRTSFTQFIQRQLADQLLEPGPIHRALAALKLPLWLSGAYDGLLSRAMGAYQMFTGADVPYRPDERPTVVRLMGNLTGGQGVVVLAQDYENLGKNESNCQPLIAYLQRELQGKLILFLGYDPDNPDFVLLVDHLLNRPLALSETRGYLVWPVHKRQYRWHDHPLYPIAQETLTVVHTLHERG